MEDNDTERNQMPSTDNQAPATMPSPGMRGHSTKNKVVLLIVVAAVVIVGVVTGTLVVRHHDKTQEAIISTTTQAPAMVSITASGFVPATVHVSAGQTVEWTNTDSRHEHAVASDPYPTDTILPGLNSKGGLQKGNSYTYIFETAGTYTYHDTLNPALEGTVIVGSASISSSGK